MENKSILKKIKSKYLYNIIFNYINYSNFEYILFKYSKFFQKILNIELDDYRVKYIDKLNLEINSYFYYGSEFNDKYDKNILKKYLESDLKKYNNILDFNAIQKYIINYYFKSFKSKMHKYHFLSIYSPFFDILSKIKCFNEFFIIPIPISTIEKFKLENDYISTFDKLNKSNSYYSSLELEFKDGKDVDFLQKFNINFSKIKKLLLTQEKEEKIENYDYFFKTLFSLNNIENNLIFLEFDINGLSAKTLIDSNSFNNLNNLKSLQELKLYKITFNSTFILKLYNLKLLYISNCENIAFDENNSFNIKKMSLIKGGINEPESLIKFPQLEECELLRNYSYFHDEYEKIIDFKSLSNLKSLKIEHRDFKFLQNLSYLKSLEYIDILYSSLVYEENIEQILSLKNLKNLSIEIDKININMISQVKLENNTLEKINIDWKCNNECQIYNLLDKFRNLSYIMLESVISQEIEPIILEIKENNNCKINSFSIYGKIYKIISFYCQPYKDLVNVEISIENEIKNLKDSFPIFKDISNIVFESLTNFLFHYYNNFIDLNIINNIYNNIDNMPNLKNFELICVSKDIDEDFYEKIIKKLLSKGLNKIKLDIQKEYRYQLYNGKNLYTKDELKIICPNMKCFNLDDIKIKKIYNNADEFIFEFL